jgi:hypothetical protein
MPLAFIVRTLAASIDAGRLEHNQQPCRAADVKTFYASGSWLTPASKPPPTRCSAFPWRQVSAGFQLSSYLPQRHTPTAGFDLLSQRDQARVPLRVGLTASSQPRFSDHVRLKRGCSEPEGEQHHRMDKTHRPVARWFSFRCRTPAITEQLTRIGRYYFSAPYPRLAHVIVEESCMTARPQPPVGLLPRWRIRCHTTWSSESWPAPRQMSISSIAAHWMWVGHASG